MNSESAEHDSISRSPKGSKSPCRSNVRRRFCSRYLVLLGLLLVGGNLISWFLFASNTELQTLVAGQMMDGVGCEYVTVFGLLSADDVAASLETAGQGRPTPRVMAAAEFPGATFFDIGTTTDAIRKSTGDSSTRLVHLEVEINHSGPCFCHLTVSLLAIGNFGSSLDYLFIWTGYRWVPVWSDLNWNS